MKISVFSPVVLGDPQRDRNPQVEKCWFSSSWPVGISAGAVDYLRYFVIGRPTGMGHNPEAVS